MGPEHENNIDIIFMDVELKEGKKAAFILSGKEEIIIL